MQRKVENFAIGEKLGKLRSELIIKEIDSVVTSHPDYTEVVIENDEYRSVYKFDMFNRCIGHQYENYALAPKLQPDGTYASQLKHFREEALGVSGGALLRPYTGPDVVIAKGRQQGVSMIVSEWADRYMSLKSADYSDVEKATAHELGELSTMKKLPDVFDISGKDYQTPDQAINHGAVWTSDSVAILERTLLSGASLSKCCTLLGRTRGSILSKLREMRLIEYEKEGSYSPPYVYTQLAKNKVNGVISAVTGRTASHSPSLQQIPKSDNLLAQAALSNFVAIDTETADIEWYRAQFNTLTERITPFPPTTTKEPIMAATIETRVFINGQDAIGMSDEQIFKAIRTEELAVEEMKKTKAMPKKLAAKIEAMEATIAAMVKYVDER